MPSIKDRFCCPSVSHRHNHAWFLKIRTNYKPLLPVIPSSCNKPWIWKNIEQFHIRPQSLPVPAPICVWRINTVYVVFCLTDVCLADCADLCLLLSDGCVLVKANFSEAGGLQFCLGTILNCNDCYWQLFFSVTAITQNSFEWLNFYPQQFLLPTILEHDTGHIWQCMEGRRRNLPSAGQRLYSFWGKKQNWQELCQNTKTGFVSIHPRLGKILREEKISKLRAISEPMSYFFVQIS